MGGDVGDDAGHRPIRARRRRSLVLGDGGLGAVLHFLGSLVRALRLARSGFVEDQGRLVEEALIMLDTAHGGGGGGLLVLDLLLEAVVAARC
jgi:hypothetical protein